MSGINRMFRPKGQKTDQEVVSPDGQFMVVFTVLGREGSVDNTVRAKLIGAKGRKFIASLGKAESATFSPDSTMILLLSPEGRASLFKVDGQLLKRFKEMEKVLEATFQGSDGMLAVELEGQNGKASWAIRNFGVKLLSGHQAPVLRVAFANQDKSKPIILTSTQREIAKLWDMDGQQMAEVHHSPPTDEFNTTYARFSPKGDYFITWADFTATDGYPMMTLRTDHARVRIWNTKGEPIGELALQGAIIDVIISHDSKYILTLPNNLGPVLWTKDGVRVQEYPKGQYYFGAAFVPDRDQFLTSRKLDRDLIGEVWSFQGDLIGKLKMTKLIRTDQSEETFGYVAHPVFSSDGEYFLTYNVSDIRERFVLLWDFNYGGVKQEYWHEGRVYSAVFSNRKDEFILTASADGRARLWNYAGELVQSFQHEGPVYSANFSPDDQYIVTASADGTAKLWDLEGQLLADLNKHAGEVYAADFSPDGHYICTGSEDGTARLWPTPHTIKAWLNGGRIGQQVDEEPSR